MRRPTLLLTTIVVGLLVAACAAPSGEPGSSDGGNGSSQGQPVQTDEPTTSDGGSGGNGGGGGGGANGSVTFEITGDVNESGELPFTPILGGFFQQERRQLHAVRGTPIAPTARSSFIIAVARTAERLRLRQWDGRRSRPPTATGMSPSNDDSGATGSFTCNDAMAITETGFGTVDVHGEFDAHD